MVDVHMISEVQKQTIILLYGRDKHSLPRGALRMFPIVERKGSNLFESIGSYAELEKFLHFNRDVYINLFSDDQKKSKMYDMIFLDIDDKDLQTSFTKLILVAEKLDARHLKYQVMFSGSKGFHIYIRFKPTLLGNYRETILEWLKDVGILKIIDVSAIEPNRVTRVPYSINQKSQLYCYPLCREDGVQLLELEGILEDAKTMKEHAVAFLENEGLDQELRNFGRMIQGLHTGRAKEMIIGIKSDFFRTPDTYPECMKILVEEALAGTDLGHLERLEMGKFLLHVFGGDVDKVASFYSKMSDFKEYKTKYQLNYILKRDLKIMNCPRLAQEGICPFTDQTECLLFPSITKWINKERDKQCTM